MKISKSFYDYGPKGQDLQAAFDLLGEDFCLIDEEELGRVKHDITAAYGFFVLGETRDGTGFIGYHVNTSSSYNEGLQSVDVTGPVIRREVEKVVKTVEYGDE
jgi:hypothetical protein